MPSNYFWEFNPVIKRESGHWPHSLHLTECELNILWFLGKENLSKIYSPSIYDLAKEVYYLPQKILDTSCFKKGKWEMRSKKKNGITYNYPTIHKSIALLEEKKLVTTSKDTSGSRIRQIVNIAFPGLALYLRHTPDRLNVTRIMNSHSQFFPFAKLWSTLKSKFNDRPIQAFKQTLQEFINLRKARILIKPLNLEFFGFIQQSTFLDYMTMFKGPRYDLQEIPEVKEFLTTPQAEDLWKSYVAFLISKNIEHRRYFSGLVPFIEKVKNLANIGREYKTEVANQRLSRFFTKYLRIEKLFSGMFAENLLFDRIQRIEKVEPPEYDIDIIYEDE